MFAASMFFFYLQLDLPLLIAYAAAMECNIIIFLYACSLSSYSIGALLFDFFSAYSLGSYSIGTCHLIHFLAAHSLGSYSIGACHLVQHFFWLLTV